MAAEAKGNLEVSTSPSQASGSASGSFEPLSDRGDEPAGPTAASIPLRIINPIAPGTPTHDLRVPPDALARTVLAEACGRFQISPNAHVLVFAGRILDLERPLNTQGVESGCTLHLARRPPNTQPAAPAPQGRPGTMQGVVLPGLGPALTQAFGQAAQALQLMARSGAQVPRGTGPGPAAQAFQVVPLADRARPTPATLQSVRGQITQLRAAIDQLEGLLDQDENPATASAGSEAPTVLPEDAPAMGNRGTPQSNAHDAAQAIGAAQVLMTTLGPHLAELAAARRQAHSQPPEPTTDLGEQAIAITLEGVLRYLGAYFTELAGQVHVDVQPVVQPTQPTASSTTPGTETSPPTGASRVTSHATSDRTTSDRTTPDRTTPDRATPPVQSPPFAAVSVPFSTVFGAAPGMDIQAPGGQQAMQQAIQQVIQRAMQHVMPLAVRLQGQTGVAPSSGAPAPSVPPTRASEPGVVTPPDALSVRVLSRPMRLDRAQDPLPETLRAFANRMTLLAVSGPEPLQTAPRTMTLYNTLPDATLWTMDPGLLRLFRTELLAPAIRRATVRATAASAADQLDPERYPVLAQLLAPWHGDRERGDATRSSPHP